MAKQVLFYYFISLFSTIFITLFIITNISCLPNIRILVNNENLQSPPYLLETIKQVEALESKSQSVEAAKELARDDDANKQSPIGNGVTSQQEEVGNKRDSSANESITGYKNNNNSNRAQVSEQTIASSNNNIDSIKVDSGEKSSEPIVTDKKVITSEESVSNEPDNSQAASSIQPQAVASSADQAAGFSLVREETIEEILDEPPVGSSSLPANSNGDDLLIVDDNYGMSNVDNGNSNNNNNNDNKFLSSKPLELIMPSSASGQSQQKQAQPLRKVANQQTLPVTNAHLKKPANLLVSMGGEQSSNLSENNSNQEVNQLKQQMKSGGAKSLITASVALSELDDTSESLAGQKKSHNLMVDGKQMPPDTLEPSQIMQGVTNASLVPATITKEYGQHSRTRITLGGGYVRDRLPPLVNPGSADYNDDKPEKPAAPLESASIVETSNKKTTDEEISRVIEIPERIILPDSVLKQQGKLNKAPLLADKKKKNLKLDSRCPTKGITTFEHPTACDKYFYCEDGSISEETCPNGLMYGTRETVRDYCVHRWKAVCDDKTIPNPISSPGCRWQFGIFNVQGSPKCSPDFYECSDGLFQVKKCSIDGQVYDDRTKSCQFAEQIGCAKEALADFQCPPDDQANTYWPFPRYFLNERALIHCVNDKPEIIRCTSEERVDPEHLHCVPLSKLLSGGGSVNLESRKIREKKSNITTQLNA